MCAMGLPNTGQSSRKVTAVQAHTVLQSKLAHLPARLKKPSRARL